MAVKVMESAVIRGFLVLDGVGSLSFQSGSYAVLCIVSPLRRPLFTWGFLSPAA